MEVITLETIAYQELMHKLNTLISLMKNSKAIERNGFHWIDNKEFCTLLKITSRTARRYRERRLISYSQIGPKIYYKSTDVEAFLQAHHIKPGAL